MKQSMSIILCALFFLLFGTVAAADECPEINSALRHEMELRFPHYIPADRQVLNGEGDRQNELSKNACPHITHIGSAGYVILLKKKNVKEYLMLYTAQLVPENIHARSLHVIDRIDNIVPVIKKAKGGFYSDMNTHKNFTISRGTTAVSVTFSESGQQFIYKSKDQVTFEKHRIE